MRNPIYPGLVGEMAKHGDKLQTIAELIGLTVPSVWRRMNGKKDWTISEVEKICEYYNKGYYELFEKSK